jgi:hypothetical protein
MAVRPAKDWRNETESNSLAGAIDAAQTAITLSTATAPSVGVFQIQVDDERMDVTAGFGTINLTVVRGATGGGAAVSHSTGAVVRYWTSFAAVHVEDLEDRMFDYTDAVRTEIPADGAAAAASLRSIGTGAVQAAAGSHVLDAAAHSSGRELAYAARTSDLAVSGTGYPKDLWAVGTAGAAVTITFTAGTAPIWLFARVPIVSFTSAAATVGLYISDPANVDIAYNQVRSPTANDQRPLLIEHRLGVLIAGQSYTYKLRHGPSDAVGTLLGNPLYPIFLTARAL